MRGPAAEKVGDTYGAARDATKAAAEGTGEAVAAARDQVALARNMCGGCPTSSDIGQHQRAQSEAFQNSVKSNSFAG